jgi:hypothetical protein
VQAPRTLTAAGQLPVYPPGPLCNPKGLTALGQHLIQRVTGRGMILETDHLSFLYGMLDLARAGGQPSSAARAFGRQVRRLRAAQGR